MQQQQVHSYVQRWERKARAKSQASVRVVHVPVRARDRYAIARESRRPKA